MRVQAQSEPVDESDCIDVQRYLVHLRSTKHNRTYSAT